MHTVVHRLGGRRRHATESRQRSRRPGPDDAGNIFYFNLKSEESVWEAPPAVLAWKPRPKNAPAPQASSKSLFSSAAAARRRGVAGAKTPISSEATVKADAKTWTCEICLKKNLEEAETCAKCFQVKGTKKKVRTGPTRKELAEMAKKKEEEEAAQRAEQKRLQMEEVR